MRISLSQAIDFLDAGKVIAVPTETVYGLAACINQPQSIEEIFQLKHRPSNNPLIIHIDQASCLDQYVSDYPPRFKELSDAFWPGPMTCILPVKTEWVDRKIRANLPTAGFRVPAFDLTRRLIENTGPLVMPSANLSGRPSATHPEHIEEDFGIDFPILDGGVCSKGIESTILVFQGNEWLIARLGALAPELFFPVLGYQPRVIEKDSKTKPLCPGQHFRHYAPQATIEKNIKDATHLLGFKERGYPAEKRVILLGSLNHPEEVAENLYHALRQLDIEKATHAWVDMDFPQNGLWKTIAERLLRAQDK